MREASTWPYPSLADALLLPAPFRKPRQTKPKMATAAEQTLHDWAQFSGASRVLIAPNLQVARHWILRTDKAEQTSVLLPPHATHELVESVKQHRIKVQFGRLDADLCLHGSAASGMVWLQPALGLPARSQVQARTVVAEYGDTVPGGNLFASAGSQTDVAIFGLHLSPDPAQSGALLAFANESQYQQVRAYAEAIGGHIYTQAAHQLARVRTLATQQWDRLTLLWTGLHEAAGLPMPSLTAPGPLAHGIALRVPAECAAATFWQYAQGENTPVWWMPRLRPLHYAAVTAAPSSAAHLEPWVVIPAGPQDDRVACSQTVLGIVKTAEFLGVRWRLDPSRAARYAALLVEKYGPDHDAYRPVFDTSDRQQPGPSSGIQATDLQAPACSLVAS